MLRYMEKFVPCDFYEWMDFCFRIVGLLPPKGTKKKILYYLLAGTHFFLVLGVCSCLEWLHLVMDSVEDVKTIMLSLSVSTLGTIILFRIVVWFFTKNKLYEIQNIIGRDSFDFRCFSICKMQDKRRTAFKAGHQKEKTGKILGYENMQELWRTTNIIVNEDRNDAEVFRQETMARTRMLCCLLHLSLSFTCVFVLGISFGSVLVTEPYDDFNVRLNVTSTYRNYPYNMYFPVDTSLSHGSYWWRYYFQLYAYIARLLAFVPVDTIITSSIIHIISQTTVVGEAFRHVDDNIDCSQSSEEVLLIKQIRIVKCINELQEIYRTINLLEKFCNVQLLIQYAASVFILCSLCYLVGEVNNVGELISSGIFLTASLGEIFICTYCCQTLSLELQKISHRVYELDWSSYPPSMRRSLVLLTMRLQKPCVLTAGKIFDLELPFFIQVVQKAYSFYTLINNTGH